MSTKRFCDGCGKEITESSKLPLVLIGPGCVVCEAGREETDFCRYCLIDALVKLDDRPKQAQPEWSEPFWCAGCKTGTHCEKAKRCLAQCVPSDLPPACDHAELVRLVKAWRDTYRLEWSDNAAVEARMALSRHARTLP